MFENPSVASTSPKKIMSWNNRAAAPQPQQSAQAQAQMAAAEQEMQAIVDMMTKLVL
jgi:hypothetical protein